jgi:hypothetical protein
MTVFRKGVTQKLGFSGKYYIFISQNEVIIFVLSIGVKSYITPLKTSVKPFFP